MSIISRVPFGLLVPAVALISLAFSRASLEPPRAAEEGALSWRQLHRHSGAARGTLGLGSVTFGVRRQDSVIYAAGPTQSLRSADGGKSWAEITPPSDGLIPGLRSMASPFGGGAECHDLIVFDSDRSGAPDLYTVPTDGGQPRLLTSRRDSGDYSRVADWSPDGRQLVFQGKRAGNDGLFLVSCMGGVVTPLPNTSGGGAPAWSPDGRRIAFVRQGRIVLLDLSTGDVDRGAGISDSSFYPAWSPDGSRLAFVGKGALTWEIFVRDMRCGAVRQLTHATDKRSPSQGPAWSPDGRRIAFDRKLGEDFDIFSMNADGANAVRLTHGGGVNARPSWSADGRLLAFHSTRDRPSGAAASDLRYFEIYTMTPSGKQLKRLTHNNDFDGHPDL